MILNRVGAYANVSTRVRGMIGNLLSDESFTRLSACPDFHTLIAKLSESSYGTYLADSEDAIKSPRRAAYEIRKKLTNDFITIINHAPKFTKDLLNQVFKLYEVDNLKAVLRGIELGEGWEKIRYMLFPVESYQSLPFEEMVQTGSVEDAIQILHKTEYEQYLKLALDRYREEHILFPLEVALDLNYWRVLWKDIDLLPREDQKIAHKLIGMMVDKNNLSWALRYRKYHHFSESEIINYTLPFGYRIDDDVIRAIANDKDPYQIVAEIYPKIAENSINDEKRTKAGQLNETLLMRLIYSVCRKTFAENSFNIGLLIAYLFVLEMEIQDLTLLFEAKSLEITAETYSPYLIHNITQFVRN